VLMVLSLVFDERDGRHGEHALGPFDAGSR
jgi:hypothetical protein